jgi:hypothetical protein
MATLTRLRKRKPPFLRVGKEHLLLVVTLFWMGQIAAEAQNYSGPGQSDPSAQSEQSPDSSAGKASPGLTPEGGDPSAGSQTADTVPSEGMSNEGVQPETSSNAPLPEAPPPELPGGSSSGPVPIPNADAIPDSTSKFGAVEIPGYTEAMNAAKNPSQAKGNKQLIESLRDVFPINGNPLKDLFTPQPQFVTPQTLMNPQPTAPKAGESNPLKGLFTPQPQYVTPQTLLNPEPSPAAGEINHFKGVFTAQPQFPTAQTLMNPHPLPRYYVKERLPDHFFEKSVNAKDASGAVETPLGPSKPSEAVSSSNSHPLRQAMLLINSAREEDAVALMDRFLVQYPGNFQARYVKAVALVRLRRLGDARSEYKTIVQFSNDVALRKLAQEGMTKLDE